MTNNYIYIKFFSNENISLSMLEVKLINKYNKVIFTGKTDYFGKIKIPACDNEIYKLVIFSNSLIKKVPLIARKTEFYGINISNISPNNKKNPVTIVLMDKYNPNIKIERGKMIIWQDIQSQ